MSQISRRRLVKGAAWATPVVIASSAIPAYAASQCNPTIAGGGYMNYDWGVVPTNPKTTATTTQSLSISAQISASQLPVGAVITDIRFEYWIQSRDDGITNPDGSSGSHGPGIYDPGNTHASTKTAGTCTTSYSTITGCSYKGTTTPLSSLAARPASSTFTSGTSKAAVTSNWVNHSFTKLNGSTVTAKAWQFQFIGDPKLATAQLTKNATTGCLDLPTLNTPQFYVSYANVPQSANTERTIYVDRTAYITYTVNGVSKTLTMYQPSKYLCDSSASGGVNRC